jgi:hypothetical protein
MVKLRDDTIEMCCINSNTYRVYSIFRYLQIQFTQSLSAREWVNDYKIETKIEW